MATIGPSITITAAGPGGVREISFSNFYCVGQTPWGIENTWQVCSSFQEFLRRYGGISKIALTAKTGTCSVTSSSAAVVGTGTTFTTDAPAGSRVTFDGGSTFYLVSSVTDNTHLTLTTTYAGTTNASASYSSQNIVSGTTTDTLQNETNASVAQCYAAVKSYFTEKQSNSPGVLFFCRSIATSAGPTAASKTFADSIGTNNTTVTAKWKGLFGGATQITITNPSPTNSSAAQIKAYHPHANITEYWDIVNSNDAANASKKSELITITLPTGGQLPVTASAVKLNSGTAATADTYSATDNDYVGTTTAAGVKTGLQVFNDQKLGTGFVAIPGKYSSTIRSGINTHASTYYRVGLLGAPSGLNGTTVVTDLGSTNGADLDYVWPQVYVQDDASTTGGQLLVDSVGHRAGLYARMDRDYRGPHKSAAGITHPLLSALDVERASGTFMELCDDSLSNTLADSLINTVRIKGNPGGIVYWGNRTLSQDNRYRQVSVRRILHLIYLTSFLAMETYTFEPIDPFGRLFAKVKGDLDTFLFGLWRNGTLYGNQPGQDARADDAWFVVCNASNNPGAAIANGELHVDVAFVPTFNAEKITENLILTTPGFINRAQ